MRKKPPVAKFKKVVPEAKEPTLATEGSSGYDVYVCRVLDKNTKEVISNMDEPIMIPPGESVLFGSGIALEMPPDIHAAVPSRTGLAVKHDIEVGYPGAPIDSDFRGEFTVLLRNFGKNNFEVRKFMRVAQLVFQPRILVAFLELSELSETARGTGSHGHSGLY